MVPAARVELACLSADDFESSVYAIPPRRRLRISYLSSYQNAFDVPRIQPLQERLLLEANRRVREPPNQLPRNALTRPSGGFLTSPSNTRTVSLAPPPFSVTLSSC